MNVPLYGGTALFYESYESYESQENQMVLVYYVAFLWKNILLFISLAFLIKADFVIYFPGFFN